VALVGRDFCSFDRHRCAGLNQQNDFDPNAVHFDHGRKSHRLGLVVQPIKKYQAISGPGEQSSSVLSMPAVNVVNGTAK
jgi:hypothetical protein